MVITVATKTKVRRCTDCPHCIASMDGSLCAIRPMFDDFVFPEGRKKIHPKCPLLKENK